LQFGLWLPLSLSLSPTLALKSWAASLRNENGSILWTGRARSQINYSSARSAKKIYAALGHTDVGFAIKSALIIRYSPPIPIGRPPTIAVVKLSVLYSLLSLPIALNRPGLGRLHSDLHTNDNSVPLFIRGAVTGLLQRCPSITLVCSCTCSVGIIVMYTASG